MFRQLATALLVALVAPLAAGAEDRTITVTGRGEVSAPPDMATIRLGVQEEAGEAAAAMSAMARAMEAILADLAAAGVAEGDVQTSDLSLFPRYDHRSEGRPKLTGYVASQSVRVEVRELADLGPILDRVVGSGANQMNGLSFGLSEPGEALDEARRRAVRDARDRAELYAAAAGLALGEVLSIREGGGSPPPMPMMEARMAADAVPVAAGEVDLSATVVMVFAIGD